MSEGDFSKWDFLEGDVWEVAPRLLGCVLVTEVDGQETAVRLTEVEAYAGAMDPASHAFRGMTPRNKTMFQAAGFLYCYRSYGIHTCANVVAGEAGMASGILLRGGEPLVGERAMMRRRGRSTDLVNGPGKLTQALGITLADDGTYLLDGGRLRLEWGAPVSYRTTPRVGISKAVERQWRFVAVTGARNLPNGGNSEPLGAVERIEAAP